MDAAERAFIARGVERVSLEEVAAEAGQSRRMLQRCFNGKPALLAALRERFIERFCLRLADAMDRCAPDDWNGRLRAWIVTGVDTYLDQVALHDVVFHDARHERQRSQRNPVADQLAGLLEGGVQARAWAIIDPRMTAGIFFHAMHSAVDSVIVAGEPYDRRRAVQTLIGYFERSVQWWARC